MEPPELYFCGDGEEMKMSLQLSCSYIRQIQLMLKCRFQRISSQMADTSLEFDAIPEAPRSSSEQNASYLVEQHRDTEEREALEQSIQQDTRAPTADWSLKNLLLRLEKELTNDNLEDMKYLFSGQGGLAKGVLEKIKTPKQLFSILQERLWLTRDNLLRLQAALKATGRMDLVRYAAEYSQKIGNILHFYPAPISENGFRGVKLHIYGRNYENATRDDIQTIRMKFAELMFCPIELICIAGVEPATSLILTVHIPESYMVIFKNLLKKTTCKARLKDIGIDIIEIQGEHGLIHCSEDEDVVSTSAKEQYSKLYNVYQQLEEKTKLLDSAEMQILELEEQMTLSRPEEFKCEKILDLLITQSPPSEVNPDHKTKDDKTKCRRLLETRKDIELL